MNTISSPQTPVGGTKNYQPFWGCHGIYPLLKPSNHPGDPVGTFFPYWIRGMGDAEKFHSDLAYLLLSPKKATKEKMVFGLAVVWVHPYQAHIPTLDEVQRKLTLLILLQNIPLELRATSAWPLRSRSFFNEWHWTLPVKLQGFPP